MLLAQNPPLGLRLPMVLLKALETNQLDLLMMSPQQNPQLANSVLHPHLLQISPRAYSPQPLPCSPLNSSAQGEMS